MSTRVLFIHGLGSCGTGEKASALRGYFGNDRVLAPDLDIDPDAALAALDHIIRTRDVDLLVGSSLGGFYAIGLNARRPVPTVLINPAVTPWRSLKPYVGTHRHWCTGETFELTSDHLARLRTLARSPDPAREHYLVLLAENDEVLDYREAAAFLAAFDVRIEPGDNHRFRHLARYLPAIGRFGEAASQPGTAARLR